MTGSIDRDIKSHIIYSVQHSIDLGSPKKVIVEQVLKFSDRPLYPYQVIDIVQSIPGVKISKGTIRKYLSRYSADDTSAIQAESISDDRSVYYYEENKRLETNETISLVSNKNPIPFELRAFFDRHQELFIHNIQLILRHLSRSQLNKFEKVEEYTFMQYKEKIKFKRNNSSVQIYFKCGDWKKSLNYIRFLAFAEKIRGILETKNLGHYYDSIIFSQMHINVDNEGIRLNEVKYISLKAFSNQILVLYDKGPGTRFEEQRKMEQEEIGLAAALGLLRNHIDVEYLQKTLEKTAGSLNITRRNFETSLNIFNSNSHKYFTQFSNGIDELRDITPVLGDIKDKQDKAIVETLDTKDLLATSFNHAIDIADRLEENTHFIAETQRAIAKRAADDIDAIEVMLHNQNETATRQHKEKTSLLNLINTKQQENFTDLIELTKISQTSPGKKVKEKIELKKLSRSAKKIVSLLTNQSMTTIEIQEHINISAARISQILNEIDECDEFIISKKEVRDGSRGRPKLKYRITKKGDELT